jgi:hypothetical protein
VRNNAAGEMLLMRAAALMRTAAAAGRRAAPNQDLVQYANKALKYARCEHKRVRRAHSNVYNRTNTRHTVLKPRLLATATDAAG